MTQALIRNRNDKFGKWTKGKFFTYAQGFRVNAACTAKLPANNYTKDDLLRIYKFMIEFEKLIYMFLKTLFIITLLAKINIFMYQYMHLR